MHARLAAKPRLRERAQGQHDVRMRIAGLVVVDPVRHLPPAAKRRRHIVPHQRDVLHARQLGRKRNHDLARQLSVGGALLGLDPVPQRLARPIRRTPVQQRPQPRRRLRRKRHLGMGHDLIPVKAVIGAGPLIQHPRAVPIRRRRDRTAARAARDHLRPEMIDRHAPARPGGPRAAARSRPARPCRKPSLTATAVYKCAVKCSTDAGRRPANTAAGSRQPTSFEEKATTPAAPDHGDSRIHGGGSEAARRSDPSAGRTRLWQPCITRREMTPHHQGQR